MAPSLQGAVDPPRPLHGHRRRRIRHGIVPAAAQLSILLPPRWSMRPRHALLSMMLGLLAAATLSPSLFAQSPASESGQRGISDATRQDILAARDAIWRAFFADDSASLRRLLPAAVAAGDATSWQDRAAVMKAARRFADAGGKLLQLKFDGTTVSLFGDVAVVRSIVTVQVLSGGKTSTSTDRATEVFVHQQGAWVNPFWHTAPPG
jgi:hypothetical protein